MATASRLQQQATDSRPNPVCRARARPGAPRGRTIRGTWSFSSCCQLGGRSLTTLTADDFAAFFKQIHGCIPFPWQQRLVRKVANDGTWPDVLSLPTGSGKTAAIDIALFHLALEAERGPKRRAPVRIAFVVDRRIVVDDAWERAKKIAEKLGTAKPGSVAGLVAERLRQFSSSDQPLIARRLRGGVPREDDWARTPSLPTVLCSTVDQIGSRLLFRGYGVSDRMKPVHAGLIGSDCLILLDEAHLAEPFRQTLKWISGYRGEKWRDAEKSHRAPWSVSLLTATPGGMKADLFGLENEDLENETLRRRLDASKPARLISLGKSRTKVEERDQDRTDQIDGLGRMVTEALEAVNNLKQRGVEKPAVGVVLNRVASARWVFEQLKAEQEQKFCQVILLIGPARPVDRDDIVKSLDVIRTGAARALERPLIVVATQC